MEPVPFERYFQGLQKTTPAIFYILSAKRSKLRSKAGKVSEFCFSAKWPYFDPLAFVTFLTSFAFG